MQRRCPPRALLWNCGRHDVLWDSCRHLTLDLKKKKRNQCGELVWGTVRREDPLRSRHGLLNPVSASCFGFHQLPLSLWFLSGGGGRWNGRVRRGGEGRGGWEGNQGWIVKRKTNPLRALLSQTRTSVSCKKRAQGCSIPGRILSLFFLVILFSWWTGPLLVKLILCSWESAAC